MIGRLGNFGRMCRERILTLGFARYQTEVCREYSF
jgi:hypothetical protein